jgi:DNA-binding MarR family transcriptional regulator
VLVAIAGEDAVSIAALAEYMGMDRSTLTRNLQPLINDNLVVLGAEGWRRSRLVSITAQGRERMNKALPFWKEAQKTLRNALGTADWGVAIQSLDRLSHVK